MNQNKLETTFVTTTCPLSLSRKNATTTNITTKTTCGRREPSSKPQSTNLSKSIFHFIISKIKPKRKPKPPPPPGCTPADWTNLVQEFEYRSNSRFNSNTTTEQPSTYETIEKRNKLPLNSPRNSYLNPAQFEMLPYVESASMACLTLILWYFGRIFKLDSFLILFYPLPTMYIASRWGIQHADRTLCVALFLLFMRMGPLYSKIYFMNSGLLTMAYSRALWYRFTWLQSLLFGAIAKAIGVWLSFVWAGFIFRENSWVLFTSQVTLMLQGLLMLIGKVIPTAANMKVSMGAVQVGVIVIIGLYSLYHVFCTLIVCTLLLVKVKERVELAREPRDMPFILMILRKAEESDPNALD